MLATAAPGRRPRLGLIVNPIAGMGGRVGLKGTDGTETLARARQLGASPEAGERARVALAAARVLAPEIEIFTWPSEMGEAPARAAGWSPAVLGSIRPGRTTSADTRAAAAALRDAGVDLLLYAGGDGTAGDILAAVGSSVPTLGIPAGVKVFSATFGVNPARAGELAAAFVRGARMVGEGIDVREAEVLDLDEEAYRAGRVSPRLAGYLRVPFRAGAVQGGKAPSGRGEAGALGGIASQVIEQVPRDAFCVLGPGTTVRAIAERLGVPKTLTGVDVVRGSELLVADADERTLARLASEGAACIVVTPIGGQGFLFGRGNPQIGPRVLSEVARDALIVVATPGKLAALGGRPLLVDTGDPTVDAGLVGWVPVVTGYRERTIYRVSS
jgi:predicted polyphosphate/ATP-dependent NAD kinase